MFILRQTSVNMAVLLYKQAKLPFILIIAVCRFTYELFHPTNPSYLLMYALRALGIQIPEHSVLKNDFKKIEITTALLLL